MNRPKLAKELCDTVVLRAKLVQLSGEKQHLEETTSELKKEKEALLHGMACYEQVSNARPSLTKDSQQHTPHLLKEKRMLEEKICILEKERQELIIGRDTWQQSFHEVS